MGVNSLPKTVTRQRRDCDLNPGPCAPEYSTQTTRLPSHPLDGSIAEQQQLVIKKIHSSESHFQPITFESLGLLNSPGDGSGGPMTHAWSRFSSVACQFCSSSLVNQSINQSINYLIYSLERTNKHSTKLEYCNERVCLCVCVFVCPRSYLRNHTSDLHQIFVHVTYDRGSVLVLGRSDVLRISGFMADVIFAHKLKHRGTNIAQNLQMS